MTQSISRKDALNLCDSILLDAEKARRDAAEADAERNKTCAERTLESLRSELALCDRYEFYNRAKLILEDYFG